MTLVTGVEVLEGYCFRVRFDNGSERVVDLESDLWGPVFEALRDPKVFRSVRVDPELGTLVWPNGADLDPDLLSGAESPSTGPGRGLATRRQGRARRRPATIRR
jgi:hypothetical protein